MEERRYDAPLVSVIIPTYNRPTLTIDAIESVRAQTYPSWELLVVDDGSTDDTLHVLGQLISDRRVHLLSQTNRGQAAARNLGLKHARGDWIAFLDSDDLWLPNKLSDQMSYIATHPDVDVLYGDLELVDLQGVPLDERPSITRHSGRVWRHLLRDNFVPFSTAIVRANLLHQIGGFDETIRRADDYDMWLRLSLLANFQFQPVMGTRYRMAGTRISDNVAGRFQSNLATIERFLDANPTLLSRREMSRVRAETHGRFSRGFADRGDFLKGMHHALRSLSYMPTALGSWRTLVAVAIEPIRRRFRTRRSQIEG